MSNLISRNKLIEEITETASVRALGMKSEISLRDMKEWVEDQPIVEPVRVEWIKKEGERMTAQEASAYNRGFEQGLIQGRVDARLMKENADGCLGCAFGYVEEWELPCAKCKRNCKDYWRAKVEE